MRAYYLLHLFLLLCGCGTIKTTVQDERVISDTLRARATYCTSIPRVYSGLAYNWCLLNAPPTTIKGWNPTLESTILDMGLSAIADTVMLPFTLIAHIEYGALNIPSNPTSIN